MAIEDEFFVDMEQIQEQMPTRADNRFEMERDAMAREAARANVARTDPYASEALYQSGMLAPEFPSGPLAPEPLLPVREQQRIHPFGLGDKAGIQIPDEEAKRISDYMRFQREYDPSGERLLYSGVELDPAFHLANLRGTLPPKEGVVIGQAPNWVDFGKEFIGGTGGTSGGLSELAELAGDQPGRQIDWNVPTIRSPSGPTRRRPVIEAGSPRIGDFQYDETIPDLLQGLFPNLETSKVNVPTTKLPSGLRPRSVAARNQAMLNTLDDGIPIRPPSTNIGGADMLLPEPQSGMLAPEPLPPIYADIPDAYEEFRKLRGPRGRKVREDYYAKEDAFRKANPTANKYDLAQFDSEIFPSKYSLTPEEASRYLDEGAIIDRTPWSPTDTSRRTRSLLSTAIGTDPSYGVTTEDIYGLPRSITSAPVVTDTSLMEGTANPYASDPNLIPAMLRPEPLDILQAQVQRRRPEPAYTFPEYGTDWEEQVRGFGRPDIIYNRPPNYTQEEADRYRSQWDKFGGEGGLSNLLGGLNYGDALKNLLTFVVGSAAGVPPWITTGMNIGRKILPKYLPPSSYGDQPGRQIGWGEEEIIEPWEVVEDRRAHGGLISLANGGNPSVYQAGENIEKLLATKMGYEGNKYSGIPNQQGMINTVNQGIGDNVRSGLRSIVANAYAQGNVPAPSVPQYNQAQLLNKGLTMLPNTANTPVPQQPQQPPAQGNISNVYAQSTLPQSHYMQPNQVT